MPPDARKPKPVDWIFTIPFLVAFGTALVVFDPAQRLARLFGRRPQEITVGVLQVVLVWAIRICGTRIEVERSGKVQANTPYLFIVNHQSMFDIPILSSLLFRNFLKFVSKRELARWIPSISYNLRVGGSALIDRGDREQATRAIRELGEFAARRGVSAVIYPEGTRAREGELGSFKPAGTRALLEGAPMLPVVPITIDGSWQLLRYNLFPVPFGTRVRVRIGDPIAPPGADGISALLEAFRAEMEENLASWRRA